MNNKSKKQNSSVGDVGPNPGDFRLGSMESRAAARALLEGANREKKRMYRVFEDGILVTEVPHDWDIEEDFTLIINHLGRCAEDVTEPPAAGRLEPKPLEESQPSRTDGSQDTSSEGEFEAALEAARESRVAEYIKQINRQWRRRRRGYRRFSG